MVLLNDLTERAAEVAHERAADTAGVHLRDLHAGLFQESAVHGDLTELIFNEHDLLAAIGLRNELFDKRRLSGAEEAGENVDLCHGKHPRYK